MSDVAPGSVLRGAVDLSSLRNRPAPGAQPASTSSVVTQATDADFGQLIELSKSVPVVVEIFDSVGVPTPELEQLVTQLEGKVVLARVDAQANPQITQALQVQGTPMGIALIGAQPVPLFVGAVTAEQLHEIFVQLLQLATQQGVTGVVPIDGDEAPAEKPLPPLHAAAFAAIEAGEYDKAIAAYEQALGENPRDEDARAGLGQVKLLLRIQGVDLQQARAAAANAPRDLEAQFLVADLDVAGGHLDDAFGRLLELFADLPADERGPVRERLVELFGLVGEQDERVARARKRLTSLLF